LEQELLDKIDRLEQEKRQLVAQNTLHRKTLIDLERRLGRFEDVKEQRDWLLDEMTKKISDLSHFRSELFKSERLSAIGEMSARLAHDMRNPLAIIKNTVEIVKLKHSPQLSQELQNMLTAIDSASSRLVFQLDQVLNFVRMSPLSCDEHSLGKILESALNKIVIPDSVKIYGPYCDAYLYCDAEKIEAVFTNLIMNAIQAMENSGSVTIRFSETDDAICFDVQDEGPGIPDSAFDKIFEPLFTTKSRGTGLGLPTVKSIVQQHEGVITVTNNPTTFSIMLPKVPA
jgi:signal transduction histidine kinase